MKYQYQFMPGAIVTVVMLSCSGCASHQNWQDFTGNNRSYAELRMTAAQCQLQGQSTQPVNASNCAKSKCVVVVAILNNLAQSQTFNLCMQAQGWQQTSQPIYYPVQVASNDYDNGNNGNNSASSDNAGNTASNDSSNDTSSGSTANNDSTQSNDASDSATSNQASTRNQSSPYFPRPVYRSEAPRNARTVNWMHRPAGYGYRGAQRYQAVLGKSGTNKQYSRY